MSQPLHGLVLAGGRSARMGCDKAVLDYHGAPQSQHLARLLAPFCDRVFISLRADQVDADFARGLTPIVDAYPQATPLNGILSAMRAMPGASWLVVAVDMPAIDRDAIETLLTHRDPARTATCFESPAKGGADPLFAVWESHAFAALEARVLAGKPCARGALKALGANILVGAVSPRVLANANTPQEYAALRSA